MIISKERTRPVINGHSAFIKKMISLDLSFICGFASFGYTSIVARVKYKGEWINYIDPQPEDSGILPFLITNLKGKFVISESAKNLYNKTYGKGLLHKTQYLYTNIPDLLSKYTYSGIETNKPEFIFYDKVESTEFDLNTTPLHVSSDSGVIGRFIFYKPKNLSSDTAKYYLSLLKKRCEKAEVPTYLRGNFEEPWLLENGWVQPIPGKGLYIPKSVYSEG